MAKITLAIMAIFLTSAFSVVNAESKERWNFGKTISDEGKDGESPFPEYVTIDRHGTSGGLAFKLPKQKSEKRYAFKIDSCVDINSIQTYSADDKKGKYDLKEGAHVCDKDKKISVNLSWSKKDSSGKWAPIAIGSYAFEPAKSGSLLFSRTNTEEGSTQTITAKAEYSK